MLELPDVPPRQTTLARFSIVHAACCLRDREVASEQLARIAVDSGPELKNHLQLIEKFFQEQFPD